MAKEGCKTTKILSSYFPNNRYASIEKHTLNKLKIEREKCYLNKYFKRNSIVT